MAEPSGFDWRTFLAVAVIGSALVLFGQEVVYRSHGESLFGAVKENLSPAEPSVPTFKYRIVFENDPTAESGVSATVTREDVDAVVRAIAKELESPETKRDDR